MKRFSMINLGVKKRLLIKGITLSFLGIILIIGMGVFATIDTLSNMGTPFFFLPHFFDQSQTHPL
ncbi:MAG: hypothetical protein P0S93_06145 [Candidatus Neptunochlamydia sp.]|nr:hypothetical protein [Candidatus Neptunochlamydia sp.]